MTSFRIWLGPFEYDRMLDFLPNQENYAVLRRIVNFFVKDPLEFDIGFRVRVLPRLPLASESPSRATPRLGWNTWLFSEGPEKAREERVTV